MVLVHFGENFSRGEPYEVARSRGDGHTGRPLYKTKANLALDCFGFTNVAVFARELIEETFAFEIGEQ